MHNKLVAITLFTGQLSDNKGASLLLPQMPKAKLLLVNQGYDANCFREGFLAKGFTPSNFSEKLLKNDIKIMYDSEKGELGK